MLIKEAEMRAEHQELARVTMLDLAKALDEANLQRRDLPALWKNIPVTKSGWPLCEPEPQGTAEPEPREPVL